jgi:hypothetical protein
MFSLKQLFVAALIVSVAVLLGASMSMATVITPTAIPYHSPDGDAYSYPAGNVSHLIDGLTDTLNNRGVLYDDTTFASPSAPITGYAVFDLGTAQAVTQAQLFARLPGDGNIEHLFPHNVSLFYYNNDTASGFTDSTAIASDPNVTVFWTGDLPDIYGNPRTPADRATIDFSAISKRYIGLRLNSSWHDSANDWGSDQSNACSQMAEVNFVTPEPSAIVILATGLIGLLCYAWRKRK